MAVNVLRMFNTVNAFPSFTSSSYVLLYTEMAERSDVTHID